MHGRLPHRGVDAPAPETFDRYLLEGKAARNIRNEVLRRADQLVLEVENPEASEWWQKLNHQDRVKATLGAFGDKLKDGLFYKRRACDDDTKAAYVHQVESIGSPRIDDSLKDLSPEDRFERIGKASLLQRLEKSSVKLWGVAMDAYFGLPSK